MLSASRTMAEFNLLKSVPSIRRDVSARLMNKESNRLIASQFGEAYFDGSREQGYGGYFYDGRWISIAESAIERYQIVAGCSVLDIGCAKGFFIHDLMKVVPGLDAYGIDISSYALANAPDEVLPNLILGSADSLPYEDNSFDVVFSINTIHNLDRVGCVKALKEMVRVAKDPAKCFVQVDAYRNADEKALFEAWMLTAKTYCTPEQWHQIFNEAGYIGDYFWTILEFEDVNQQRM